jgi:hypothetical protein
VENDVSLFVPSSNIAPHYLKFAKLYRFPYFWEDDINMMEDKIWNFSNSVFQENGLKIFDFHPLHIYFNFSSIEQYQNFKIKNGYKFSDKASVNDFINRDSDGAQTFFRELVSALSNRHSYVIEDLRKEFFET